MASTFVAHPTASQFTNFTSTYVNETLVAVTKAPTTLWTSVIVIATTLLIIEQAVWRMKKRNLPGDSWTIPIIGKFADSLSPTLENYISQWNKGELSAISVFNIFIVMASTNEYARKVFNAPQFAEPCIVASAKQVLCPENWVFLNGKAHVDYRRMLNNLFTRKALAVYVETMDRVAREHFANWLEEGTKTDEPTSLMTIVRLLNMHTSLAVFCGNHIERESIESIFNNYWKITKALELVNFPLAIPGTKIYGAIQARKTAMKFLTEACGRSRAHVANGGEVNCLIDEWHRDTLEAVKKAEENGKEARIFTDHEMALAVLSFLFASQDAMSSGVIYMFQHLADRPDMLAKVREEQDQVRAGDYGKACTLEMVDSMTYLKAFIKDSLRLKPPVTMVPYKTLKPYPINPSYTVPANSMIIPSIYPSLHDPDVYENPSELKPERWLDPNSKASLTPKNYLVFGAGPHRCIGVEYTLMNMACVMGIASCLMEWDHVKTEESEEVQMIATLFPKDGCLTKFRPRAV